MNFLFAFLFTRVIRCLRLHYQSGGCQCHPIYAYLTPPCNTDEEGIEIVISPPSVIEFPDWNDVHCTALRDSMIGWGLESREQLPIWISFLIFMKEVINIMKCSSYFKHIHRCVPPRAFARLTTSIILPHSCGKGNTNRGDGT